MWLCAIVNCSSPARAGFVGRSFHRAAPLCAASPGIHWILFQIIPCHRFVQKRPENSEEGIHTAFAEAFAHLHADKALNLLNGNSSDVLVAEEG